MKGRYHIKVSGDDKTQFEKILRTISISDTAVVSSTMPDGDKVFDYILDLSKYELLYLRLAAKSGEVVDITDKEMINL